MGGGLSTPDGDAKTFKNLADIHFRKEQYYEAIIFYTSAISQLVNADGVVPIDTGNRRVDHQGAGDGDMLVKLYGNRSAAYVHAGSYQRALDDALRAIELDPLYCKGYYRAAKALLALCDDRNIEAIEYIDKAIAVARPGEDSLLVKQLKDMQAGLLRGGGTAWKGNGWLRFIYY